MTTLRAHPELAICAALIVASLIGRVIALLGQ